MTPDDLVNEMCPNCVTPWKCNGPHVPGDTECRMTTFYGSSPAIYPRSKRGAERRAKPTDATESTMTTTQRATSDEGKDKCRP